MVENIRTLRLIISYFVRTPSRGNWKILINTKGSIIDFYIHTNICKKALNVQRVRPQYN